MDAVVNNVYPGASVPSRSVMLLGFLPLVSCPCYCTSEKTDPGRGHWLVLEICHPQVSNAGPRQAILQHGWYQITPDDLSHVQCCPLSHLPTAFKWSSCLPLAQVTLVVQPWLVLWNQRDDLEFYPLTHVWKVCLWRSCTCRTGFFISLTFLVVFKTIYEQERNAKSTGPTK